MAVLTSLSLDIGETTPRTKWNIWFKEGTGEYVEKCHIFAF